MDITALKIVTDDTLKEIRKFDIVTPDLFKDTFLSKAKEHHLPIDLEELGEHSVEATLHKVKAIEEQTKENSKILKNNLDLAQTAIEQQDLDLIQKVQSEMEALNKRISLLEEQVYVDELTKAYNRKWLFEKFLINEKFTKKGTLIFIDVDKFKVINDSYGHVTGDKVLAMITRLAKTIENSNIVRYGGDEFIVISEEEDAQKLQKHIDNIATTLSKKLFKFQGNTFQVGISYGVLSFKAGDDFQTIIDAVDQKMYKHKKEKA